jgi:hypothetical protein
MMPAVFLSAAGATAAIAAAAVAAAAVKVECSGPCPVVLGEQTAETRTTTATLVAVEKVAPVASSILASATHPLRLLL